MAFDNTEPRTARIAGMAFAAVLSLVGIHYTMRSYFLSVTEGEENEVIAGQPAELRRKVEAASNDKLAKGKPIETAISELAAGRSAAITPTADTQSINLDPMKGWNETKREFSGFATAPGAEGVPVPSDIPVAGGNTAGVVIPVAPTVVDADAAARLNAALAAINVDGGVVTFNADAAVLGLTAVVPDAAPAPTPAPAASDAGTTAPGPTGRMAPPATSPLGKPSGAEREGHN